MTRLLDAPFPALPRATLDASASNLEVLDAKSASRLADWATLVKLRLSLMALFTVAVGFVLGSSGPLQGTALLHVLAGAGLLAAGASALNQVWERRTDALMVRTRARPIPAGRISVGEALGFGLVASLAGLAQLAWMVNLLSAALGLATLLTYVFAYTPLKRVTAFNTVVGAVPGALPPLIGWTAAGGSLDLAAWSLFALVFFWQFPHFWAIAWLHRRDYARAGLRMIPVLDREQGRMTGRLMVQHCLVLWLASFTPFWAGLAGVGYAYAAAFLGFLFLAVGLRFLATPSDARARHMLWASLVYLPLMLILLLWDRV